MVGGAEVPKNWGGARLNAGRRPKAAGDKKYGCTFYLGKDELAYIEEFPGNNRSERLRILIQEHKILKKRIDNSSDL